MSKKVPFQKIQFSISTQFKSKYILSKIFLFKAIQFSQADLIETIEFSISMQLVLFNPYIGPYQVLPFQTRVDLGAMAMKGCSRCILQSQLTEQYTKLMSRQFYFR